MNKYEKNLDTMKKSQKRLYDKWIEYKLENKSLDKIEKKRGNIEGEYLIVTKGEQSWRLNSAYSCKGEAEIWCRQYAFSNSENFIIMYGLGNGAFARGILTKLTKRDLFFIYEPFPELFRFVLENFDLCDILEREQVHLFVGEVDNEDDIRLELMGYTDVMNLNTRMPCEHPYYAKLSGEKYQDFWTAVKKSAENAVINVNTERFLYEDNLKNMCKNITLLKEVSTLVELKEIIPSGAAAILVAAGPSVKESLSLLKQAKGRMLIFAVDRVLDYLLENQMEPDFVVTMDPQKGLEHFTERDGIQVPVIYFGNASHEILVAAKGKKIICQSELFLCEIFVKMKKAFPQVGTTPSVATSVFSLLVSLGFKRILLVGQDLAYGEEGCSHAGGVTEEFLDRNQDCMVEGLDGAVVRSRWDWANMLQWYDDYLYAYERVEKAGETEHLDVIDVKQKGAKIPRTRTLPFGEALELYGKEGIWSKEKLELLAPVFQEEEWGRLLEWIKEKSDELYEIKRLCSSAIESAERLVSYCRKNSVWSSQMQKLVKQVSKEVKKIRERPIILSLETCLSTYALESSKNINCVSEDEQENLIKTYEYTVDMLRAIKKGTEEMKILWDEAMEELNQSGKEEKGC